MKFIVYTGIILLLAGFLYVKHVQINNVCKTFEDYYTDRDQNKNCYYNPDGDLTTLQTIQRWRYPVETHTVLTEDGHILNLFRIPYGKNSQPNDGRQPVLIEHGYKSNSKSFVSTGNKSLAFLLADRGYDVWLGNFRGTMYSRDHVHLNATDEKFWNFSFHEMGYYDVPAQTGYIKELTDKKVIYIGFSLGTTIGAIYSTSRPEHAEDTVKIFIKLAPFVFSNGMGTHTSLGLHIWPLMQPIFQKLTGGEFYPQPYMHINKQLWSYFCTGYPFQMFFCTILDMWAFGFDYEQIDPETFPVAVFSLLDSVSIKTVSHISQFVMTKEFRHFDYGSEENLRRYGTPEAPHYDLSQMRVPMYLVRSDNDCMCGKEGIEKLNLTLPDRVKPYDIYVVKYDKFNHIDFILAKDVVPLLYDHIMDFMDKL